MKGPMVAAAWIAAVFQTQALAALKVTTTMLPEAIAGTRYDAALAANGGPQPFSWSLSSGSLPGGLSVVTSGSISGVPASAGVANFTVQVKDANGSTDTQNLRLTVNPAVSVGTASLPDAQLGSHYTQALAANGGTAPFQWTLVSGSLPGGMTLSNAGTISGTPT